MSTLKTKKVRSQSRNRRISLGATYTILVILGIVWLVPLVWIVLSAFRCEYQPDGTFIGRVTSNFFPRAYGLKNFSDLFTATYYGVPGAFLKWMLNTLIIAVIDCVISTFLVLSVAYCMSKLKFKLRKAFMNITMIIGLFPGFMSMIAIYFLLKSIGLTGNPSHPEYSVIGLILAYSAGAGLGFQVAKGFFDVIPNALVREAGRMHEFQDLPQDHPSAGKADHHLSGINEFYRSVDGLHLCEGHHRCRQRTLLDGFGRPVFDAFRYTSGHQPVYTVCGRLCDRCDPDRDVVHVPAAILRRGRYRRRG